MTIKTPPTARGLPSFFLERASATMEGGSMEGGSMYPETILEASRFRTKRGRPRFCACVVCQQEPTHKSQYKCHCIHASNIVSRCQTLYLPLPGERVWWTEQGKLVLTPQDKQGYLSPPLSVCGWSLCKRCSPLATRFSLA